MKRLRETPLVALVYDFDKTLSPRDMQEYSFLPGIGVEPEVFWARCRVCAERNNMDGILAYMFMMCEQARGRMRITRDSLHSLGRNIEFFPGVVDWFPRINALGRELGVEVEHYIISSGLQEIIGGSPIAREFKAIFAASFLYDAQGNAIWPATAVNYTSKTQYLFRINKGILDITNDRDLNAYTPEHMRYIPFTNMIYIGDGLTDVPCMKLTKSKGGFSIAVHAEGETRVADELILRGRADFALPADYREGSEMQRVVTEVFRRIRANHDCAAIQQIQTQRAKDRLGDLDD